MTARTLLCLVVVLASGVAPGWAAEPAPARSVLLVYTEPRLTPEFADAEESLRETLQARSAGPIGFETYPLDSSIDANSRMDRALARVMRGRFERQKPDLVIVSRGAARFTLAQRDVIFPGVPVVLLGFQPREAPTLRLDALTTAVFIKTAWAATLDIALRLHPDTQRVVVLNGASVADAVWEVDARQELASYASRLDIRYFTGLPLDRMQAELARLPDRTIVILGPMLREGTDTRRVRGEEIRRLLYASPRPVYGLSEGRLGEGIVGGRLWSAREHGVRIAEVALRVLNREGGLAHGVEVAAGPPMFDARELERWGILEDRLPAGSVVRFLPPSAWQQYGWPLVWAGGLAGLVALVGAALLFERSSRRRVQRSLQDHLRFEQFLEKQAASFAALPTSEINHTIEESLDQIIDVLELDRAEVVEFAADGTSIQVTCSRSRAGVEPVRGILDHPRLAGTMERLRRGEPVAVEAGPDGEALPATLRSLAVLPLQVGGRVIGVLWLGTTRSERAWSDEFMRRMLLLAEILGDALARRRADAMAREADQRFRAAADEAPVLIWMSGPDSKSTFFNKAWLDYTGRTLAQELGDGWVEGVAPADYQRCLDTYLDAFHLRVPFRMEYRLRRADGTYGWLVDTGAPRYASDGTFLGYVGSSVDVTDLKSAQRLLEESTAQRGAIFGALYGLIAALDANGVIVAVNEGWSSALQQHGGDPGRASIGVNYLDVCRRAADDPDARRAHDMIASVLEGRQQLGSVQYRCQTPAGEQWFDMIVEPIRYPAGGVLVSHIDVTGLHRAEEEARQEREELAHALRLTAMGELIASLSHEINQPLAAIITAAQATRRLLDRSSLSVKDTREALDDIIADGQRAAQVIRRVRALLRKDHSERTRVDLNTLIAEVAHIVQSDAGRRQVVVRLGLVPESLMVSVDSIQIEQVLLNILINALEATANTAEPREVTVESVRREPGILEVRVRDTGVGIDPELLDKIFDPFVTTKSEGLGMGLSISRSIVQAHGGRIWAAPNRDRGLTVHIELPCEEERA